MNTNKPDFHQMLHTVEDWRKEYHTNKDKIIFQNKDTFTNIVFDSHSLHAIQNNSRGFENLPETIIKPSEVWRLRNYIKKDDKYYYVVQTEAGKVVNAFIEIPSRIDKYRKGVRLWQI